VTSPLAPKADAVVHELPGLEADNLLAFLALLGLLRALETVKPAWLPRVSWKGPPWIGCLHLAEAVNESAVAKAAAHGVELLGAWFDVEGRKDVKFDRAEYRSYARKLRDAPTSAALAAALTAEVPVTRKGGLNAAPLVMMFGQGHQHFLERLTAVTRSDKQPPDMRGPDKFAEALFQPWARRDDTDGFRWDPQEDQRYAMRFGDPSKEGAAVTVHGANRLAAVGFLSFPTAPGERRMTVVGAFRDNQGWEFAWPIWSEPLSRCAIEAFLAHPNLLCGEPQTLRALGIQEVQCARRISNGKFMNVTRATPNTTTSPG
jgi:hypothetical protein